MQYNSTTVQQLQPQIYIRWIQKRGETIKASEVRTALVLDFPVLVIFSYVLQLQAVGYSLPTDKQCVLNQNG